MKSLGMSKHRKSGKVHNNNHFKGKSGSGTNRKRKTSRKSRKLKRGIHKNKYSRR